VCAHCRGGKALRAELPELVAVRCGPHAGRPSPWLSVAASLWLAHLPDHCHHSLRALSLCHGPWRSHTLLLACCFDHSPGAHTHRPKTRPPLPPLPPACLPAARPPAASLACANLCAMGKRRLCVCLFKNNSGSHKHTVIHIHSLAQSAHYARPGLLSAAARQFGASPPEATLTAELPYSRARPFCAAQFTEASSPGSTWTRSQLTLWLIRTAVHF